MKTVIVIQARLGSSRLPCKTLLNLHGLPVIDWVVGRCARSELADDLVVALPDTRRDEVLARHLRAQGVNTLPGIGTRRALAYAWGRRRARCGSRGPRVRRQPADLGAGKSTT